MHGQIHVELRLIPTTICKPNFASPRATVDDAIVSNKRAKMRRHFASEERGEVKLKSLSPPRHLLGTVRTRQVERKVVGRTEVGEGG